MRYRVVLFDLDGTLTDPFEGITRCVQYAAQHFGTYEPDLEKLRGFIGPPLQDELCRVFGLNAEQGAQALAKYRERFSTIGILENKLYPGIPELLEELTTRGVTLGIASSKPQVYVQRILEHFGLARYFSVVSGSELNGARVAKSDVIHHALSLLGRSPAPDIVMVGDRVHDGVGAYSVGIPFIGVRYGYAEPGEFDAIASVYLASDVSDLTQFLLK